jgi:FtsZ-binding cell division protein ZapB
VCTIQYNTIQYNTIQYNIQPLSTKLQSMAKESDNRRDEDIQYLLLAVQQLKERDQQRQFEIEELKENVDNLIIDNEELRDDNDRLAKKIAKCEPTRRSKRLKFKGGLGLGLGIISVAGTGTRSSNKSKKK